MIDGEASEHAQIDFITEEILDSLQNLIAKAAALSRYFWPARDGKNQVHKRRADLLCRAFAVNDGSPLKDRELRNCMEHFDERLDHYLSKLIIGHIIPSYVGLAPDKVKCLNIFSAHTFRISAPLQSLVAITELSQSSMKSLGYTVFFFSAIPMVVDCH